MGLIMRRPAYEIVLSALRAGLEVRLGKFTYVMRNQFVYIKMVNEVTQQTHCIEAVIWLNKFVELCDSLSEEELFLLSQNTALNEYRRTDG